MEKASTEVAETASVGSNGKKANAPPDVITCDPKAADSGSEATAPKNDTASQARTPKHANKSKEENAAEQQQKEPPTKEPPKDPETVKSGNNTAGPPGPPPSQHRPTSSGQPPAGAPWGAGPPPAGFLPPSFDPSRLAGNQNGAFQPRDRHFPSGQHQPPPMQVSPGGGRYYFNNGGRFAYAERFNGPAADFSHGPGFPQQRGYGGPPPLYPQQFAQGFDGPPGRAPPSWGPPPSFQRGPPHPPPEHYGRSNNNNNANFSRAVSSSFDRSIKSGDKTNPGASLENSPKHGAMGHHHQQPPAGDSGSVSEDASWGALKQVHSVDEEEMRKRLSKRKAPDGNKDVIVNQPASNSSSLTNSPTEGIEGKKPAPQKQSSLDSLSSVASAQEPIDTKDTKAPSPDGTAGSLDLMKCPSGTSALLLPSHQRSHSHFSTSGLESVGAAAHKFADIQKDGKPKADLGPSTKKARIDGKSKSPLSITCSPSNSPGAQQKKNDAKVHQPQAKYPPHQMESAPHLPRDGRPEGFPPRPGSSASSTITPMDGVEIRQPPPLGQMPSWEIQGQDSFGATSTGGNVLMGSFSFPQDYPMLGASASEDKGQQAPAAAPGAGHVPPGRAHPNQTLESRNQSFEGGHYHGSFDRSNSMMSYEGRQQSMSFDGAYQGQFPPHAPSWGSAGSYPIYGAHRIAYPGMMRNFSEDSGARTSPPPPSAATLRMMPPNFPPPPEFRAPPSMVNKQGSQQNATILTSPYNASSKVGPFGWSKEEDNRLTEIMKKYKNPRDWEPIAKEHGRNRSAKECHERWIRYLKPGVRKGQWTDHEDAIVMDVVSNSSEQPFTRWSDLAQRLPGRVGKQIRDRWVNHLNPAINHLPFSREDDLMLWNGHKKLGKRWVEISTKCFNNTRSENHIKNRWYSASFKKFISNEFGPDAYNGGKPPAPKKDSPKKKKAPAAARSFQQQQQHAKAKMDPSQMEAV